MARSRPVATPFYSPSHTTMPMRSPSADPAPNSKRSKTRVMTTLTTCGAGLAAVPRTEQPAPMPAAGQRPPLVVGPLRGGVQLRAQSLVAHHQSARDPQPAGSDAASNSASTAGAKWAPNTSASLCPRRSARRRTRRRPPAHSRGSPSAPPRAARSGPATRAAAGRGRR